MTTLLNKWFIAGCMVWAIVFTARRIGSPVPWVNGYITDAFAIPVIANLGLWFQRVFIIKSNFYVLSGLHILFIVIYVSLIFEALLPILSAAYTADAVDVVLYAAGGLFFYKVMNKPAAGKTDSRAGHR